MATEPGLKRNLSLPMVILYGLGTTIGAGIYALLGEVAASAGMHAPLSFVIASLLAAFTAFSFAELSSRFPRAAGVALYVQEGLGLTSLATITGLLVVFAGTVSAAAILNAFAGYFNQLFTLPDVVTILFAGLLLGLIVVWGIKQSVLAAGLFTLIEVGGVVLVIWVARGSFTEIPARLPELIPHSGFAAWHGILAASFLAFYAFLGFEDMVSVAEEIKDVRRVLPLGIVITLVLTTILYMLLALVSVLAVSPSELGRSPAALVLVYERVTGHSGELVSVIGIIAIINGALIQILMASRVLYGMSRQGTIPRVFGLVYARTSTPVFATVAVTITVIVLALWFPLAGLAEVTSFLTLVVFSLVNYSLLRIKKQQPVHEVALPLVVPKWVPAMGFIVSSAFVIYGAATWIGL